MEAVLYENLLLILGNTPLSVYNLSISEESGKHGMLSVNAATEEENKEYLLYEESGGMALYAILENALQPIFQGMVIKMDITASGGICEVYLEAVTESYWMDISVQNRSFQDIAMSSHQLVKKVLESYWGSQILFSIPDEALGRIAVQYQETDWAFLNRILSEYNAAVYVDSASGGICLRAGLMNTEEDADWDSLPYTVQRDTAPKDAQKELKGQIHYIVETYDILPLGERVQFHGQELYIGKVNRRICQGFLINEYYLYFKEGLIVKKYYNPLLSGVSINGTVTAVKRNRLQAMLETDALSDYKSQYFFPFSTVAASPDGSGWYCMPKKGDQLRIFFPTADESEGYAIANLQGESAPAQDSPISNPNMKDITMPDGKAVKFIEGGIQICVGEEKGTITLTNDGKVEIKTEEDIEIHSAGGIAFSTDETMEVIAGTQIQITNDSGGSICMTEDAVEIHAHKIANN